MRTVTSPRPVASGALSLLLASVLAPASRAQADERRMPFDYSAPEDCPGAEAFAASVARRTAGAWQLRREPGQPRLSVEIAAADGTGMVGVLRRTGDDTATAPREVRASDCRDLVQALALTVALSLERGAPPAAVATRHDPDVPAPRLAVGVALSAAVILPPAPMTAAALFVELGQPDWSHDPFLHLRWPDLTLTVAHARNDILGPNQARFDLTTASLAACPLGWGVLRACGVAEAGVLDGRGVTIAMPRSNQSLWMAAGGLLRAKVSVGRHLFAEAYAGARAPLRRTEFTFEVPEVVIAKVPAVVFDGGLALAAWLP